MGKNFLFSKTKSSWHWGPPTFLSKGQFLLVKRPGLEFDYAEFTKERSYKSTPAISTGVDKNNVTSYLDIKLDVTYIFHFPLNCKPLTKVQGTHLLLLYCKF